METTTGGPEPRPEDSVIDPSVTDPLGKRQLTFGEKAVGLSFNPSKNPLVDSLKRKYASIIDDLNEARKITEDGEAKRYLSTAITQAEISQMLAVKAVTWGDGIFLTTGEDLP